MNAGLVVTSGLLAVASAPHCMGMCGPVSCAAGEGAAQASYQLTRGATYVALGAAAGAASGALSALYAPFGKLLAFATALVMLASAAKVARGDLLPPGALVRGPRRSPWVGASLGAATALLPCGALHAALLTSANAGDAAGGALAMAAFAAVSGVAVGSSAVLGRLVRGSALGRTVLASVIGLGAVLVVVRGFTSPAGAACHSPTLAVAGATP